MNAIRDRGSSGWEVGDRLVLIFHKRRGWQLDYFARELANGFDDVATVDNASLRGRNLDGSDPRAAFYLQGSVVDGRRVNVPDTHGVLSGEGVTDAAIAPIAPIQGLFDGYAMTPDNVRRRLHAF